MRKNSKSKLIIFLFFALIFMGIGYATLQSNLSISGTTQAVGSFDIEITNVSETNGSISNGGVTVKTETHTTKSATFTAEFTKPGDYVEYYIKVENLGSIDGILCTSTSKNRIQKDGDGNDIYLFEVTEKDTSTDYSNTNIVLEVGEYKEIIVKMSYNSLATEFPNESVTFTFEIEAIQKGKNVVNENGEIVDASWDFRVDSNGVVLTYNKYNPDVKQNGYVVVPATNSDGEPITEITSSSFLDMNEDNVIIYEDQQTGDGVFYIDYPRGSNQFNVVKSTLNSLGIVDSTEAQGTSNNKRGLIEPKKDFFQLKEMDNPVYRIYGKGEITIPSSGTTGFYIDPTTGQLDFSTPVSNVTKVNLTNATNLVAIRSSAFENGALNEIIFPQNGMLSTIENKAFKGTQLTSVTIPNTVTTIGTNAFYGTQLQTLSFENNSRLQSIGADAFRNCQLRGTVSIPTTVTSIGDNAFNGSNNQITTLSIPNSVTTISNNSFQNTTITSLSIDMTTIPNNVFTGRSISTLVLGNHVQTISEHAFTSNQLSGALAIPSSVTSIGNYAFGPLTYGSTNTNMISSLSFASGSHLQTIGEYAFCDNAISGTVVIPSSVTTIGRNAFSNYGLNGNGISVLDLSNATSLQTIGFAAFSGNQISALNLSNATSLTSIGESAFYNNQISGTLIIPSSVTTIGDHAFSGESDGSTNQISTLDLSNATSLQTIGSGAFQNNNLSGTLVIPSSVTNIGFHAFEHNQISGLSFTDNGNLESIGSYAFAYNPLNGVLTIPSSVTTIYDHAFIDFYNQDVPTYSLTTLTIPNNVTSIGERAFGQRKIDNLIIDTSSIDRYTFTTNSYQSITFGSHVTSISSRVLGGSQIASLTIPSNVTYIAYDAFLNSSIESLSIDMENLPSQAFRNMGIQTLLLGSHVRTIPERCFYDNRMQTITIDMTRSEWDSNVQTGSGWFGSGSPTMTFNSE